jgi:UDP-N-acetylmuramoyl-L-alanyl-D-glutamate--2,6-diaminopimelate ligase
MKLNELLRDVDGAQIRGAADVEVTGITADSRRCTAGSMFVAVPGHARDGIEFVASAVGKGAAVIVAERDVDAAAATFVKVSDARAALATIAANYYARPASKLAIVGVTGTSGKTTTTKMIESIFDATGEPAGLIGTIEYRAGEIKVIAVRTTPDAVALQRWFRTMVDEGVTRAVMEVSSHALDQKRTFGVQFAAAVFMNLSRDHLDYHTDMEDYFRAKRILFDQIDRSKRVAVMNIDDEYGRRLADEMGSAAITFGRSGNADVRPSDDFEVSVRGLRGELQTPIGAVRIESPLIGYPNLSNWMGAVGAAIAVGVPREAIERGVAALGVVKGRFERVDAPGTEATFLVDYAHKPDALEKLLTTTRQLAPDRRIIVVFGCGGDRDQGKRAVMGEIAGRLADLTIVTSDNPRSEKPEAIIRQVEEGVKKTSGEYEVVADRRQAIVRAVELADDRTIVLVAGKGHENYQVVGDQILHFDDREELESALRKKADRKSR